MFITPLKVQPIRGTDKRCVLAELIYRDLVHGRIVTPRGFISNYASIPKWVPRWILDQDGPAIRDASVVHDYLYSIYCLLDISRKEADAVLYRAMLSSGSSRLTARVAYWSVRLFGGSHWKQNA